MGASCIPQLHLGNFGNLTEVRAAAAGNVVKMHYCMGAESEVHS